MDKSFIAKVIFALHTGGGDGGGFRVGVVIRFWRDEGLGMLLLTGVDKIEEHALVLLLRQLEWQI